MTWEGARNDVGECGSDVLIDRAPTADTGDSRLRGNDVGGCGNDGGVFPARVGRGATPACRLSIEWGIPCTCREGGFLPRIAQTSRRYSLHV